MTREILKPHVHVGKYQSLRWRQTRTIKWTYARVRNESNFFQPETLVMRMGQIFSNQREYPKWSNQRTVRQTHI
jgi:hypothetical protein